MKVVINSCFGGFSPSEKVFEKLIDDKGWTVTKCDDSGYSLDKSADIIELKMSLFGKYSFAIDRDNTGLRSNPDLISVIEELGDEANTRVSELKIVEVPDDVEFQIEEYDGLEHIAEVHRTWR